jgi:hypothetical protein
VNEEFEGLSFKGKLGRFIAVLGGVVTMKMLSMMSEKLEGR